MIVSTDGKKRCKSCLTARNNINKRHHPRLFDDDIMMTIMPDIKSCDDQLRSLYNSLPPEEFSNDANVRKLAKLMKIFLPENVEKVTLLSDADRFVLCNGDHDECLQYAVLSGSCQLSLCSQCMIKCANEQKQVKRKDMELCRPDPDKKTKANSRCNFQFLSPDEVMKRVKNMNEDRKQTNSRIKAMKAKLSELKESFDKDDAELLSCVQSALNEVNGNKEEFTKALLSAIMENEVASQGKKGKEAISEKDYADFIDQVNTEMKNFSLRISNKVRWYDSFAFWIANCLNPT